MERHVVEVGIARSALLLVDVSRQVLRDEPVEQHPQYIRLKVPPIDATAQVIGNAPDGLMKFGTFGFGRCMHRQHIRIRDSTWAKMHDFRLPYHVSHG